MKLLVEEMCGNLVEIFGAVVILSLMGGMFYFFRDFADIFICHFLG